MRKQKKMQPARLIMAMGVMLLWPGSSGALEASDGPETIEIDSMAKLYGGVHFDHALHTKMADCVECHHHTTGVKAPDPNCIRCHAKSGEAKTVACRDCHSSEPFTEKNLKKLDNPQLYHIDKPGLKAAYHLNCIGCHQITAGPTGCQDCHTMTEAGEKMFQAGKYAPTGTPQGGHSGH
jgi:hypothetical protein